MFCHKSGQRRNVTDRTKQLLAHGRPWCVLYFQKLCVVHVCIWEPPAFRWQPDIVTLPIDHVMSHPAIQHSWTSMGPVWCSCSFSVVPDISGQKHSNPNLDPTTSEGNPQAPYLNCSVFGIAGLTSTKLMRLCGSGSSTDRISGFFRSPGHGQNGYRTVKIVFFLIYDSMIVSGQRPCLKKRSDGKMGNQMQLEIILTDSIRNRRKWTCCD